MDKRLIYVTVGNGDEARRLGETLVRERLVACANVLEGLQSIYWWEGEVQSEREALLLAKTTAEKVDQLIARVKELHSYDCPCVVALPIEAGNPDFLKWIEAETR